MKRITALDEVQERVWRRLVEAAEQPGDPLRLLTFGTVKDDSPRLRTVVLRETDPSARRLAFHCDSRSEKVSHIEANAQVAWLGWDPETGEQVRLQGEATVHREDGVADAMWAAESPQSLDVYVQSGTPGASLDAPDDLRPEAVKDDPVTQADVEEGRSHFAVVRTVINEIEWLHLHPDGHYRARFAYDVDAETFDGTWMVP